VADRYSSQAWVFKLLSTKFVAVHPWHAQVQQDEVGELLAHALEGDLTIGGFVNFEPGCGERQREFMALQKFSRTRACALPGLRPMIGQAPTSALT
jgi:hypothetical protein